ncbi:MAG: type II toxin-antitoxin system prevent-host-death family antitoxin [Acidobacteria bacterium]|nr:MAG: type II toxin-antitoxin system prevent-host-death family antitoxin [Acidobacteriota bacterium]MCE7960366.1 type II toxin-antitoxin system prevent-host-death family antitoxin [Acidobacteria bacterium ACB2]
MKRATISEAKNSLSALIDRVRHGETVLILDRKVPVARLVPAGGSAEGEDEGRLARLERAGLVRRGSMRAAAAILDQPPPEPAAGGDVLAALLAERRDSR